MRNGPLSKYPIHFAACRDLGHAWLYRMWDSRNNERTIVCSNCGTVRHDHLQGYRVDRRSYTYAKGYQMSSDLEIDIAIEARRLLSRLAESQHIRWTRDIKVG